MRPISFLSLIAFITLLCSCRADFQTTPSNGQLAFSKDTVYLDTVFSNISTSTYRLKVYNRSKNDINIPSIRLKKGLNSKYRLNVDGTQGNQGKLFNNVTLLAKDSLFIFIEATANSVDASSTDFLYTDEIEFDSGSNLQKVNLVTLVQDAVFLFPKRLADGKIETIPFEGNKVVEGFYLNENSPIHGNELNFTNKKPYVIYGYAAVPEGKTATFEAGTRVYFHTNSGLIVSNKASIKVNGTKSVTDKQENNVFFEGDRLEPELSDLPGQWGIIWLQKGSTNNQISNLSIKNATIGLFIQDNDNTSVAIKNTQIYNSANYGILAQNAKIEGQNLVVNFSRLANLAITAGGNYQFTHCTFNNNWNSSMQVAVSLSNKKLSNESLIPNLTQARFNNCIIYGSYSNELALEKEPNSTFNYQFTNCLIKYRIPTSDPNFQFQTDTDHYSNIILNQDPKFENSDQNKLNIEKTSGAFAKGNPEFLIPLDIKGNTRTSPPDIGAYQSMDFPKKK